MSRLVASAFTEGFSSVLGWGIKLVVLIVLFRITRGMSVSVKMTKAIIWCLAISAAMGYLAYKTARTHVEDSDPIYGGGEVVEDSEPTTHDQEVAGWSTFFFCFAAFAAGTISNRYRPQIPS